MPFIQRIFLQPPKLLHQTIYFDDFCIHIDSQLRQIEKNRSADRSNARAFRFVGLTVAVNDWLLFPFK